jgi:hypothetical protein
MEHFDMSPGSSEPEIVTALLKTSELLASRDDPLEAILACFQELNLGLFRVAKRRQSDSLQALALRFGDAAALGRQRYEEVLASRQGLRQLVEGMRASEQVRKLLLFLLDGNGEPQERTEKEAINHLWPNRSSGRAFTNKVKEAIDMIKERAPDIYAEVAREQELKAQKSGGPTQQPDSAQQSQARQQRSTPKSTRRAKSHVRLASLQSKANAQLLAYPPLSRWRVHRPANKILTLARR